MRRFYEARYCLAIAGITLAVRHVLPGMLQDAFTLIVLGLAVPIIIISALKK